MTVKKSRPPLFKHFRVLSDGGAVVLLRSREAFLYKNDGLYFEYDFIFSITDIEDGNYHLRLSAVPLYQSFIDKFNIFACYNDVDIRIPMDKFLIDNVVAVEDIEVPVLDADEINGAVLSGYRKIKEALKTSVDGYSEMETLIFKFINSSNQKYKNWYKMLKPVISSKTNKTKTLLKVADKFFPRYYRDFLLSTIETQDKVTNDKNNITEIIAKIPANLRNPKALLQHLDAYISSGSLAYDFDNVKNDVESYLEGVYNMTDSDLEKYISKDIKQQIIASMRNAIHKDFANFSSSGVQTDPRLRAIAIFKRGNAVVGYRLYHETTNKAQDMVVADAMNAFRKFGCINLTWDKEQNKVVGAECSIDRVPVVDVDTNQVTGDLPIIVGRVDDGKTRGFKVVDYQGNVKFLQEDKLIEVAEKHGLSNAKLVTKDDTKFISAIKGEFPVVEARR